MKNYHRKTKIYDDCRALHPDGRLMFLCTERKIKWYLSKNLACLIDDNPLTIQLNFIPKGLGNIGDPYSLINKINQCVVCGKIEKLTRHHVVPSCYRRFFPDSWKGRCSHDILPLCINCHRIYEVSAFELKRQLSQQYDVPMDDNSESADSLRARNHARALLEHKDVIPLDRQELMKKQISNFVGKEITEADILRLSKSLYRVKTYEHGKKLLSKIDSWMDFVKMWRRHFISEMKPKFMPSLWSVDYFRF